MEKYLTTYAIILGLIALINEVGFIGIYSLLKKEISKNKGVRKMKNKFNYTVAPGTILKEYLNERNITQKEFTKLTNSSERHVSCVINGKQKISAEFALKIESVLTDTKAEFWLALETNYRLHLLRKEIKMAKKNRLIMKYNDFVEKYSDAIEEFANEEIRENEEEYFDGYTSYSDEDYFEVIEENWDEFVRLYAEKIDILLYDDHE